MNDWLKRIGILLMGLLLGASLGLYLGWVAWPTEFTDADLTLLDESYKRDYTIMIAAAYSNDGDLAAAQQQLRQLRTGAEANPYEPVLTYAVDLILTNGDEQDIRYLVRLADALGLSSPAIVPYLPPPAEGSDGS